MAIRKKLSEIQVNIKAPKNLYNKFGNYHYRNAEGICEAVKPFLNKQKCSLVLFDEMVEVGGRVYVKATAQLMDNESDDIVEVVAYARESIDKKGMDDSQITGSASSYARKYALNGLFLLDDTKDADTDEYREYISNAKAQEELEKAAAQGSENIPETEEACKDLCSDKQVKFIKSLISNLGEKEEDYLSKYSGKSSFAELSKSQAKSLIDYLNRQTEERKK